MALTVFILVIGVFLLIILIVKELGYIKELRLKKLARRFSLSQPYRRVVVPSPSVVKEVVSKERPRQASWLRDITSRISEIDLGRNILKRRLVTQHANAEAEKEYEQGKKEKLRKKIEELQKRTIKQFVKPTSNHVANAIELAMENTELEHQEEPEIPIITHEQNSEDQFNSHLAALYKKIDSHELTEAKEFYQELVSLYNELVEKAENKIELYNAVKDAHDKLAAAIEEAE